MTALKKLIFIRHGATDLNEKGIFISDSDPALNSNGIEQINRLANWLGGYLEGNRVSIVSSPALRALQTSEIIKSDLINSELIITERCRERELGKFEGLSADELATQRRSLELSMDDMSLQWSGVCGVEQDREIYGRFEALLNSIEGEFSSNDALCIVSHAGFLKAVIYRLLNIPETRPYALRFSLGSAIVFYSVGEFWELTEIWKNPLIGDRFFK